MSASAAVAVSAPAPVVIPGWLVFTIDDFKFALPQREIKTIELATVLDRSGVGPEAGWFHRKSGASWPAYHLDGGLHLQTDGRARLLCVFFTIEGETRGLLCDRVWLLSADDDLDVCPVPGCIADPLFPITGFDLVNDDIVGVTGGAALVAYVTSLLETGRAD